MTRIILKNSQLVPVNSETQMSEIMSKVVCEMCRLVKEVSGLEQGTFVDKDMDLSHTDSSRVQHLSSPQA